MIRFTPYRIAIALAALWLCFPRALGSSAEEMVFFEKYVRPVLAARCYECHGPETQKAGLRLDSQDAVLAGSRNGPVIDPEKPRASLLIVAVSGTDPDLIMPKKGKRLSEREIAHLTEWIRRGAPWPTADGQSKPVQRRGEFTEEDRSYWAFQPMRRSEPPAVKDKSWPINEVDYFILDRLENAGLSPAPSATKRQLARRAYFDLHGLPPTAEQINEFLEDASPKAYERLIDRLLSSPRYGERWARHWLDLVRYAESDGYRGDFFRPRAWRYRDYVIDAFNEDKPYDRFVMEQLAGDEIAPNDPEALTATGYLRHGIYEWNQRDVRGQWEIMLDDVTETTADAFLGLGMGCARCHDHKFDPILQKDYFRLRAYFTPMLPRDDLHLATSEEWVEYTRRQRKWEKATKDIRARIEAIEKPVREASQEVVWEMFEEEFQQMMATPKSERSPLEHQLAELAFRQIRYDNEKSADKIKGDARMKRAELLKELAAFDSLKPEPLPSAFAVTDAGPYAPATFIPKSRKKEDILPGIPSILDPAPAKIEFVPAAPNSTGRRTALARWMTQPDNPLTARVMANRIWQYHFGEGLASTPSDFGRLGEPPSHPRLLDWLALEFIEGGWRLKAMHKLIMTSAAYRQSSLRSGSEKQWAADPDNRLLWRFRHSRLEAEQIRDAMLAASGELDVTMGGPSVEADEPRRSVYTQVIRNTRDPLLDAFDLPYAFKSLGKRNVTTTSTQSLLMINGPWVMDRARAFAERLMNHPDASLEDRIRLAHRLAFARAPEPGETAKALDFIQEQAKTVLSSQDPESVSRESARREALTDYCHALLNSNEFIYVD